MFTQREYNKIIHDWIKLLTDVNGSNIRPQRNEFGFGLVDGNGKPIAFYDTIIMFYVGISGENQTVFYEKVDTSQVLKTLSISISVVGENADIETNKIQSLCMGETSRNFLRKYGLAIDGTPNELISDKKYAKKWFYSRTLTLSLNSVVKFTPPNTPISNDISVIPIDLNNKQFTVG